MQTMTAPTPLNGSVQMKNRSTVQPVYNVFKTTNYGMFKMMNDNRQINLLHVERLIESFKNKHLVCPIIVNDHYEIIDGQHRLQASKETGLPVYYIIVPKYGISEVQILNTHQKNWTKIDYLESYCADGRKPYLQFKKFMEDFPQFGIQPAERILTGLGGTGKSAILNGKKVHLKSFIEGNLEIPNLQYSYTVAKRILDFEVFYSECTRGTFVSAVMPLFKSKSYSHKEMIHKLTVCPIKLRDCLNVESYRMLLEDIYNHKRQKENKVSFRYE